MEEEEDIQHIIFHPIPLSPSSLTAICVPRITIFSSFSFALLMYFSPPAFHHPIFNIISLPSSKLLCLLICLLAGYDKVKEWLVGC